MNIVSAIAILLQDIANLPQENLVDITKLYIEIAHKAIQALIELCAGNFANQEVVFNAQILDTVSSILSKKVSELW